jgi:hypothetical protein
MLKELDAKLQTLEDTKRYLLRHIDSMPEADRARTPGKGQLSPLQLLAHIVFVEETVTGPFRADSSNSTVLLKGRMFMLFVVGLMRFGCRIATSASLHPKGPLDYEVTKKRWEETRILLRRKLEAVSDRSRKRPIANQPMAGPMTPDMVLDFLNVHLRYHWRYFPKTKASRLPAAPTARPIS